MGPEKAAKIFLSEHKTADSFRAVLYGSLSKTGRGHRTDAVLVETFAPTPCEVVFNNTKTDLPHENTLDLIAIKDGEEIASIRVASIGGGDIVIEGRPPVVPENIYPHSTFQQVADYCKNHNIRLSDYVFKYEDKDIKAFLETVWETMQNEIEEGLKHTGILPGGLEVERKAQFLYNQRHVDESESTR
jgi:L-serine dehydratase